MIKEAVAADRRTEYALRLTPQVRRELYEQMVLTRVFETEAERQYKAARIGGYCHLSSGQEATTSGVVHALRDDDLLVTGYRCHGFALARGVSPQSVMAELFGRSDGCAHGRGGSMHLLDVSRGFYGGWGIVAGSCRWRPASRSRSCARGDRTPCSANSGTAP
jgi:pyruvate dehydrogenase E1 component subunit alpha